MPSPLQAHPADDVLIGHAGGEPCDAALAQHLAECAECRARVADMQAAFAGYSAYLADLKRELPAPPQQWFELRARMREHDAPRRKRVIRFPSPRIWWAAAAAAAIAAVFFPLLTGPRVVSAAELLQKAVAQEKRLSHRRDIKVKIRNLIYVRPARSDGRSRLKVAEGRADTELNRRFAAAGYDWVHPLSAASFSAWRNRLNDRRDVVDVLDRAYRIETTSASNELAQVALTLRASDFHPLSETFRFRDNSVVEVIDGGEAPPPAPVAPTTSPSALAPDLEAPPLTPGDELRVIAALNRAGADLGEPVDVERDDADRKVHVTATGLNPARQEALRAALAGVPHVDLRFESLQAVTHTPAESVDAPVQAVSPMQKRLEGYFGRRALVDDYVNDVIAASERSLSRAHALRALATRFPAPRERELTPPERELLHGLVERHVAALRSAAAQLPARLEPLIGPPASPSTTPCASWQECAMETVQATQQLDAALSRALAAARPSASPEEAAAEIHEALTAWLGRVRSWK